MRIPPNMVKKIPEKDFVDLRNQRILADELRKSVKLCHREGRYIAAFCIIACGIAGFASGDKGLHAQKDDYLRILEKHFPGLCKGLEPRKFYDIYRSGIVHHLRPMKGYVMCQNQDLDGQYVGKMEIEGIPGTKVGLNLDQLVKDFIRLCDHIISGKPVP